MQTATKPTPRKAATTTEPAQAPITQEITRPAPVLLGEPAFDVFQAWISSAAPNGDLDALTQETVTAEQEIARLWKRIPEAKELRRRAAFDAKDSDPSALEHSRLGAELETLPTLIGDAEAKRVDLNLRFLACLRQYAKTVTLKTQELQKPLRAEGKQAEKRIATDESRIAYAPTLTDAQKAIEEKQRSNISKQLRPLLDRERLAIDVYELTAIRAEPYGKGVLRDYQNRLVLLSDYGRGVAVDAARTQAQQKALAEIRR